MNFFRSTIVTCIIFGLLFSQTLFAQSKDPYDGYVIYGSNRSAYLYDKDKKLVNEYKSKYMSSGSPRLLRDSSCVYSGRNSNGFPGTLPLMGGQFQIISWSGELLWDYTLANAKICPHHNFEIIYRTDDPNEKPHILAACYEYPDGANIACDRLVEIKPTGTNTAEIVWEWRAWDHRTNDPDNHPELLKEPSRNMSNRAKDWNHVNNISYNRELDQLIVDMKSFYEFVIIDHSTTTAEAATNSGGKYGKGGTLLYRWGHASNYGVSGSDHLKGFHGGTWIPKFFPGTTDPVPGAGNAMVFHNEGKDIIEIELPGNDDGIYPRVSGKAFGPDKLLWTYKMENPGLHEGYVQRLPNGNTLICNGRGSIYQITPDGEKIWDIMATCNQAVMYSKSYLDMKSANKTNIKNQKNALSLQISTNPITGDVGVSLLNNHNTAQIKFFSVTGKLLLVNTIHKNKFIWNTKKIPAGVYVVKVTTINDVMTRRISVLPSAI